MSFQGSGDYGCSSKRKAVQKQSLAVISINNIQKFQFKDRDAIQLLQVAICKIHDCSFVCLLKLPSVISELLRRELALRP